MAVRNFWIEAEIDGRETKMAGGPRAKDGGMEITIYQRSKAEITKAVRIWSSRIGDKLVTIVFVGGEEVAKIETER